MSSDLAIQWGIHPDIFHWVVIPFLIFVARVTDVSINTIRVIFMLNGQKWLSMLLGFIESLIWLLAISQILQNIGSTVTYMAYSGGFASGIFVGMIIESRLALGSVIVRIITQKDAVELIKTLQDKNYRITYLDAKGKNGDVSLLFTVLKRKKLPELEAIIHACNPNAFYTVEALKFASQNTEVMPHLKGEKKGFMKGMMRK